MPSTDDEAFFRAGIATKHSEPVTGGPSAAAISYLVVAPVRRIEGVGSELQDRGTVGSDSVSEAAGFSPRTDPQALLQAPLGRLQAAGLNDADCAALRAGVVSHTHHRRGEILPADEGGGHRFLASGWAFLSTAPPRRRGPIYSIILPGDSVDLMPPLRGRCAVYALTELDVIEFDCQLATQNPHVASAFRLAERYGTARLIDQMDRLMAGNTYRAIGHLFLDLYRRLDEVGLVEGGAFAMPLSQARLASALGLTAAHVNRTLRLLRADGLIELSSDSLRLTDPDRLGSLVRN